LDHPGDECPLTHAGGYRALGFDLVAIVDPRPDVQSLAKRWQCRSYGAFAEMMDAEAPEIISFAVPTEIRADLLREALRYRPRVVVAEKPLAATCDDVERVLASYRQAGVPLIVNYSRRFVPFWRAHRPISAMSATIRYAKGVRHNGTHAIDLCRMLFGECLEAIPLTRKYDHWDGDPTVSAHLAFERCPEVFLQSMDERCFTLFEVDIVGSDWRLVVDSDGRRARRFELRENVGIPPGRRLVECESERTDAESAMLNLMRNVREVLAGAEPLCSAEDALAAQRIAARLAA
jgi:predicted dehydrogenase